MDYVTYTPSFTSGHDAPTISPAATGQVSKPSQFPTGAIAGIVVGAVVLAAAGITLWYCIARRKTTTAPFPRESPFIAVTRKEQVPPHMRQLGSPPSRGTIRSNTIDGSSSDGNRVHILNPPETRNVHELVAGDQPPPAYHHSPLRENVNPSDVGRRS